MAEQTISYEQYLESLPDERRPVVERVWRVVRENVGSGYTEHIGPKFLTFMADDDWYVALANQKNYVSLYLIPVYVYPELKAKLDASGKNLKCGKSCINFKRAEDLPLETIAEIVGAHEAEDYREHCRRMRAASQAERKKSSKKSSKK
ncbi:MAG TPA: DUF1801 domain-containing protein [Pyrinomonadaceae bacterium]|nr:DUF1801 domain-containing protein [Pyrinomonadaceae bacterium]